MSDPAHTESAFTLVLPSVAACLRGPRLSCACRTRLRCKRVGLWNCDTHRPGAWQPLGFCVIAWLKPSTKRLSLYRYDASRIASCRCRCRKPVAAEETDLTSLTLLGQKKRFRCANAHKGEVEAARSHAQGRLPRSPLALAECFALALKHGVVCGPRARLLVSGGGEQGPPERSCELN